MANNTIRIIVVDGGKDYNYNKKQENSPNDSEQENKEKKHNPFAIKSNINKTMKQALTPTGYLVAQAGNQLIKQIANQGISFYASGIGMSTGDSNYQNIVNNHLQLVSDVGNALSGIVSGAMLGAQVGGPIGAAVGAAVSMVGSVIDHSKKVAEVKRNFEFQMWKDGVSQSYGLARANYSIYTGRKV